MPTPDTPDDIKKQQKEKAEKAKQGAKAAKSKAKSQAQGEEETLVVAAAPTEETPATADGDAAKKLPKGSKVHYDGHGLMKKPKLIRRRYHKPEGTGFHPFDGIKNFFSRLVHGTPKQKPSGKGKNGTDKPADDSFPPPAGQ